MKVRIKESIVDYVSDYPDGWVYSSGDPFKLKATIHGVDCFIKRFQKKNPGSISGWNLLKAMKGKNYSNVGRVYDIHEETENGVQVHYVFYEYVPSQTLDKPISLRMEGDLQVMVDDVLKGLLVIHKLNYWLSDFCEKNILWDRDGRFLLIDLDSAYPTSDPPRNDMDGSKEFWIYVMKFYRRQTDRSDMSVTQLYGPSLNYLQLIFLVLKSRWKLIHKDKVRGKEVDEGLIGQLALIAPDANELFSRFLEMGGQLPDAAALAAIRDVAARIISAPVNSFTASPPEMKMQIDEPVKPPPEKKENKERDLRQKKAGTEENDPENRKETALKKESALKKETAFKKVTPETPPRIVTIPPQNGVSKRRTTPPSKPKKPWLRPLLVELEKRWKTLWQTANKKVLPNKMVLSNKKLLLYAGAAVIVLVCIILFLTRNRGSFQIISQVLYQDSMIIIRAPGGFDLQRMHVFFDGHEGRQSPISADESGFLMPELMDSPEKPIVRVVVTGPGNKVLLSTKMKYVPVSIAAVPARTVFEDSTMMFTGKRLDSKSLGVFFNNVPAPVVSAGFDTLIVRVPQLGDTDVIAGRSVRFRKVVLQARRKGKVLFSTENGMLRDTTFSLLPLAHGGQWEGGISEPDEPGRPGAGNGDSSGGFKSAGLLLFPMEGHGTGVVRVDQATAEDGGHYPMLHTYPIAAVNGSIRGFIQDGKNWFHLPPGRVTFQSLVGYADYDGGSGSTEGVHFQVYIHYIRDHHNVVQKLADVNERYDANLALIRVPLPYMTESGFFIELRVNKGSTPDPDEAIWANPSLSVRTITFLSSDNQSK